MEFFKSEETDKIRKFLTKILKNKIEFNIILNKKDLNKNKTLSTQIISMFKHLKSLCDYIDFSVKDNKNYSDIIPAVQFKELGDRFTFHGVPSGYEFGVFLDSIDLIFNGNITHMSDELAKYFKILDESIKNQLFVIPECQHCPILGKILITASYLNKNIKTQIYQISDFPHLQEKYGIEGVPTTIINDEFGFVGVQSENKLIDIYNRVTDKEYEID